MLSSRCFSSSNTSWAVLWPAYSCLPGASAEGFHFSNPMISIVRPF